MSHKLYIITGEKSGDTHGAEVIKEWLSRHPNSEIKGLGGPQLAVLTLGSTKDWIDQAAVMGFIEVLKKYRWFKQRFDETLAEIIEFDPDFVLFIDYPGFNLRMATALKKAGVRAKLIQYVCPQVWAWKKNRIPKIAENYDEVLCLLPFEPEIFDSYKDKTSFQATFIGHPLIDELPIDTQLERVNNRIALIPGSRNNEVANLLPIMIRSAKKMRQASPEKDYQFHIPAATPQLEAMIKELAATEFQENWLHLHPEGAHHLMQTASSGIIASGTATLEASCLGLPYTLIYRLNPLTYFIARKILKVGKVGLINVLAKRFIVQELVQELASPENISTEILKIQNDDSYRTQMVADMLTTCRTLGNGGSHAKICDRIEAQIGLKSVQK